MKEILIFTSDMRAAIRRLKNIAPSNPIMTIQSFVKVRTSADGILFVMSTDLEVAIECSMPCKFKEDFSFLIPFDVFSKIVDVAISPELLICTDGSFAKVHCGEDCYEIGATEHHSLYPSIKIDNSSDTVKIDREFIHSMEMAAMTIVKGDTVHSSTKKVCLKISDNEITIASMNPLSLYSKSFSYNLNSGSHVLLLSEKCIKALCDKEDFHFSWSSGRASFKSENITVTTTLLNDTFPKYESFISNDPVNLVLDRSETIHAIKRAAVTDTSNYGIIMFSLKEENGVVFISCENTDYSRSAKIPIRAHYDGQEDWVKVNAQAMLKVLNQTVYENIGFVIRDKKSGIIVRSEDDPTYTGLVMTIS